MAARPGRREIGRDLRVLQGHPRVVAVSRGGIGDVAIGQGTADDRDRVARREPGLLVVPPTTHQPADRPAQQAASAHQGLLGLGVPRMDRQQRLRLLLRCEGGGDRRAGPDIKAHRVAAEQAAVLLPHGWHTPRRAPR